MSGKIFVLQLLPKMFLNNHIPGFFKVQYQKKLRAQGEFLFADKYQSLLQVGAIAFGWCGQSCPKYPN